MTREEVERFLIELDGELTWELEDGIPAPPLDRVELARRFLESVTFPLTDLEGKLAGCEWLVSHRSDGLVDGVWRDTTVPTNQESLFWICESIYLARWARGWRFGKSPDAWQNVHEWLLGWLRTVTRDDRFSFTEDERLSDRLAPGDGIALSRVLDWGTRRLAYTKMQNEELLGAFQALLIFTSLVLVGLYCLKMITLWWGLLILYSVGFAYTRLADYNRKEYWTNPTLNFGEFIGALQQRAVRESEEMVRESRLEEE
ncbi:hypothetical protein [Armatimonas sp.]|uniref:hypothetical protein n=1 Tax=Armatimonas sp. TaxID=1872638 RepID=UPI00286AD6EC|nr:hypothetical protein [Armatimonas sp.]